MHRFAFIVHPLHVDDLQRKFPWVRHLPDTWVEKVAGKLPPFTVSRVEGLASPWAETEGWFIGVGLTARRMLEMPESEVLAKVIQAGEKAQEKGAQIVGLGALTAVIGDAGVTIARNLDIPVTTGNTFTIGAALAGTRLAVQEMGQDLSHSRATVVGATGSIGSTCSRILARECSQLTLFGRDQMKLRRLSVQIEEESGRKPRVTQDLALALQDADAVISVTGAAEALVEPGHLKPGAVVCDVARPRDVSPRVARERDDVLVVEGGVISVPPGTRLNFNFGFPENTAYACMAETMILALEGRLESYSLGRDISPEKVDEIWSLAEKHGFALAGLRSFERAVSPETIHLVRERARKAQ